MNESNIIHKVGKPLNSVFSWAIKKQLKRIERFKSSPFSVQASTLNYLLEKGKNTRFGQQHNFHSIDNYEQFKRFVPLQDYNSLKPLIDKTINGEQNLLWNDEIRWFAKSSGTSTGKSKFIPVSKEAVENCHYRGGKDLLAMYYNHHPETRLFNGKHLILGGSSKINPLSKNSYSGDLSAIIVKNLPWWCEWRRTPKREITLMEDWNKKLSSMVKSTVNDDVMILAGVPSWMLVFLKQVLEYTQKDNIMEVWPNLELYMHGGVNFQPYKKQFDAILKNPNMNYVQTYNASEGIFAIQDRVIADDMLLMLDYGIYYEFIPIEDIYKKNPKVINLENVETDKNYALVISTTSGLWRYVIGDTVKFTSLSPHRIIVTGRTSHFINVFGEELIIENTDKAIEQACLKTGATLKEYTVAPLFMNNKNTGGHEWLIEFDTPPDNTEDFAQILDKQLKALNSDYEAKRSYDLTLKPPTIKIANRGLFYKWLKSKGKLGGQNKIPRLSNDRTVIEELLALEKL